jgi:thiol-disulfide isomerase/thioredoxin
MKKLIYTLICLLFLQHVYAQAKKNEFTLQGQFSGTTIDSVIVSYRTEKGQFLTVPTPVVNQRFILKGNIAGPVTAIVVFKNKEEAISNEMMDRRRMIIYLEPANIIMAGNPGELDDMKISGSKSQDEYEELRAKTAPVRKEMEPVMAALRNEKDHEKQAEIREKLSPYNDRIKKITYQFFMDHPNSYVTADQVKYYTSALKLDSLKKVYNNFSPALKKTVNVLSFAKEIKKIESGTPGSMAKDFTTTDINGNPLSLSSFKGKYVLLDFWASWCVPCRKGNPHLIELYNSYHAKGFEIIGISDDDRKPELWKAAVATDHIGIWNHVLRGLNMDLRMKNLPNPSDISDGYGVQTLPTKILIDPTGKIIGRFGDSIGGTEEEMDKMLALLFKN